MFIQHFDKLKPLLLSLLCTAILVLAANISFTSLAHWAEVKTDSYPYLAGEDPMRYLLPTLLQKKDRNWILLTGNSSAGENLLYERFNTAFKKERTYPGAISTGTLDDITVLLDFISKRYPQESLPKTVVLGINSSLIANIPRRFGEKKEQSYYGDPLFDSINRYSRKFKVERTPMGSQLIKKGPIEGMLSWFKFFVGKQQPRYRTGFFALTEQILGSAGISPAPVENIPWMDEIKNPLKKKDIIKTLTYTYKYGIFPVLMRWINIYRSPYLTHYMKPLDPDRITQELKKNRMAWLDKYKWDITDDEMMTRSQIKKLVSITADMDIQLYVVSLPEHISSLQLYNKQKYNRTWQVVIESLGDVPFFDLSKLLNTDRFLDDTHATVRGARLTTDRVIELIKEQREIPQ